MKKIRVKTELSGHNLSRVIEEYVIPNQIISSTVFLYISIPLLCANSISFANQKYTNQIKTYDLCLGEVNENDNLYAYTNFSTEQKVINMNTNEQLAVNTSDISKIEKMLEKLGTSINELPTRTELETLLDNKSNTLRIEFKDSINDLKHDISESKGSFWKGIAIGLIGAVGTIIMFALWNMDKIIKGFS